MLSICPPIKGYTAGDNEDCYQYVNECLVFFTKGQPYIPFYFRYTQAFIHIQGTSIKHKLHNVPREKPALAFLHGGLRAQGSADKDQPSTPLPRLAVHPHSL